jgi:hypothetical protein
MTNNQNRKNNNASRNIPAGWELFTVSQEDKNERANLNIGTPYYYNPKTGETQWEKPTITADEAAENAPKEATQNPNSPVPPTEPIPANMNGANNSANVRANNSANVRANNSANVRANNSANVRTNNSANVRANNSTNNSANNIKNNANNTAKNNTNTIKPLVEKATPILKKITENIKELKAPQQEIEAAVNSKKISQQNLSRNFPDYSNASRELLNLLSSLNKKNNAANTGSANTGSANTGSANTGSANTGSANTGVANTGVANTVSANTGVANTSTKNTNQKGGRRKTRKARKSKKSRRSYRK